MLNDQDYEELLRPIIEMYNEMEVELIMEIAKRFATYKDVAGSLEWYVKKLNELGGLNQEAVKIIAKYSRKSEAQIKTMLENAGYKAVPLSDYQKVYLSGGTLVNPETISIAKILENSYIEANKTFKLIQTKAIEGTKKAYMDVLNQAYLEVGGGYYDYNTSIQNACKKMAKQGITCATYQTKDGKTRKMSIESVVRRDTITSVNQMIGRVNDKFIEELGAKHVEVSWHLGARNTGIAWQNHESWQGEVYLLESSNEQYKNFAETTGYGKVDGILGVNCHHHYHAFFPGFSIRQKPPDDYDTQIYELTQKQRYYERGIRSWKKQLAVAKGLDDKNQIAYCDKKLKEWQDNLQEFVDSHDQLKRDYSRERTYRDNSSYFSEEKSNNVTSQTYESNDFSFTEEKENNLLNSFVDIDKHYLETGNEYMTINYSSTGEQIGDIMTSNLKNYVEPTQEMIELIENSPINSLIIIHNHPKMSTFSINDIYTVLSTPSLKEAIVINENAEIYFFSKGDNAIILKEGMKQNFSNLIKSERKKISKNTDLSENEIKHLAWKKLLKEWGFIYGRKKY